MTLTVKSVRTESYEILKTMILCESPVVIPFNHEAIRRQSYLTAVSLPSPWNERYLNANYTL
jgi:hypothetical protein